MKDIVKLKCACGQDFEREQIPEDWKQRVPFKWKFQYCDVCYKKRTQEALSKLPEVLNALIKDSQTPSTP